MREFVNLRICHQTSTLNSLNKRVEKKIHEENSDENRIDEKITRET
jgi:hypothetical protein